MEMLSEDTLRQLCDDCKQLKATLNRVQSGLDRLDKMVSNEIQKKSQKEAV